VDIKLNFINASDNANNAQIVILQKSAAGRPDANAVAWQVIQNCGKGCRHPFRYTMSVMVDAGDSYGNFTPLFPAPNGTLFQMIQINSGDQLTVAGAGTSPTEIQVLNGLPKGAISANVYRSGKLVATKTAIAPQQKAVFDFMPTIWIGAVSQVEEGTILNSAILSTIGTEISLLGIASADIVMTGGGPGPEGEPFQFNVENIVMA
jgi:hypothetical protein